MSLILAMVSRRLTRRLEKSVCGFARPTDKTARYGLRRPIFAVLDSGTTSAVTSCPARFSVKAQQRGFGAGALGVTAFSDTTCGEVGNGKKVVAWRCWADLS